MSEQIVETKKLLDFSPEDIKTYLKVLKSLVLEDKYTISRNSNREENKQFMIIVSFHERNMPLKYLFR